MKEPKLTLLGTGTLLPFAVAALLAACAEQPRAPAPFAQPALPQKVKFAVKGAAASEDLEVFARHGVEFTLDGAIEVGPAPDGQTHRKTLPESQRNRLQEAWSALQSGGLTASETCASAPEESSWASSAWRLSILFGDRETALFRIDGGQICGPAKEEGLLDFSKVLFELASLHYPRRFPSVCLAGADELTGRFQELLACESDADCVNVDLDFVGIPAGEVHHIPLAVCSALPHLGAANAAALQKERRSLLSLKAESQKACVAEELAPVCSTEQDPGFQNHRFPARCQAQKCVPGRTRE